MSNVFKNRKVQWMFVMLFAAGAVLLSESLLPSALKPALPAALEEPTAPPAPDTRQLESAKPLEKPAPKPLSYRVAEYHINVEYMPDTKQLKGQQTFTWENPGSAPVQELYLHLYPNAFASKNSTFMKESGGKLRQDEATTDSLGSMQLLSLQTLDGTDLSKRMEFVQPDDGNKDDQTLLKVPLPKAVGPGEQVTLTTDFLVKLPEVFARMGYADGGDFVMAGQWFPKVAVYEPAGTRGRQTEGWNLHQYHGNSEFYSDFGIYDVVIKVPSTYTVAATGFPVKTPVTENNTKTYQFYADDVHDFAWSASPHFVYVEEPFSAAQVPGVKIKLYLDPKQQDLKDRYMYAAKKALARYSQWYGAYPYSTLSIVVPPEDGNGAGGMEYPTLVTAWGAKDSKPDLELERVVVHEIGHQFFYGLVASNEFEEAWLDEGFTSYAEDKLMESEYGVSSNLPVEASYITSPNALQLNAWEYRGHQEYADNVYMRAKLVLRAIEKQVGTKTMDKIMSTYFQRWEFKHPTTRDFQAVVEDVTKTKWDEFFNQYVYGSMMADYSVERIHVAPASLADGNSGYESTVLISKRGGNSPEVPIQFHFKDGSTLDKTWSGAESSIEYKLAGASPIDWVRIDPNYSLVLENKHINNFMLTEVDPTWKIRWNLGIIQFLQTVFGWVAW
ncbi:M1 family metallopeptidase [Paenibacillus hexagrammi]|uniref:M1 family metallopeptidase n=1 Tax=Paenibacillus hexagrammi TaxID=2908839 RepID=A0ABY3SI96_9BACL|nr:M1 family metallopeptidase [Paenibacillus sp. YPD9-1]UJF33632.1 M1 family metallopeptidase [Paenibacillus sp. YPD9-1]